MQLTQAASKTDIEAIRYYIEESLAVNTRIAYRKDLEHFKGWGAMIPSPPDIVAKYLSAHAESHSIATLCRWLVSIRKGHTMQGYDDPTKSDLVKLTLKGIKRVHGKPQNQASPILKEDLIGELKCTR